MYNLNTNYEVIGRTMESLLAELHEIGTATEYVLVEAKDIKLHSLYKTDNGKNYFYVMSANTMLGSDIKSPLKTFSRICEENEGVNPDLLRQSLQETGVMMSIPVDGGETAIYVSPSGINALAEKAKVGGERINYPSTFRDLYVMEGILKKGGKLKLAVRSLKGADGKVSRKLFGVLTEKYAPISLNLIPETIDTFEEDGSMGKSNLRYWKTTQNYTEVLVEFPDEAEELQDTYGLSEPLIPGIRLSTSDTGDAAVRIQATYRSATNRTYVVKKEVKKNHMGKVTREDILNEVKKEIFAEIKELPSRLASLMGNTIGKAEVETPEGQAANKRAVQACIRKAIRSLHIGKAIGQKRAKEISEQLEVEVNGELVYTEYDIAMMFIGLGDRLANLPENARRMLEKACAEAPYIKYQKQANDEDAVILLPEEA